MNPVDIPCTHRDENITGLQGIVQNRLQMVKGLGGNRRNSRCTNLFCQMRSQLGNLFLPQFAGRINRSHEHFVGEPETGRK